MPAPAGTSTALRLARIAALVLGSLLFLYACENSKSALLADKWVEVVISGALLAAGLGAAWFEIKLTDYGEGGEVRGGRAAGHRTADARGPDERREFLVESEGWSMRTRIGRSGDLIFHGHDLGGTYPGYEWMWIFHHDTFPDIRAALGDDEGDILDLLEEVVPQLDRHGRRDPGAWLRTHDIPATYREKGVSATQETRKLPIMRPGLPVSRRGEVVSPRGHRKEPAGRSRRVGRTEPVGDSAAVPTYESARSRREAVAPAKSRYEDGVPARVVRDESNSARSQGYSAASAREDLRFTRSMYEEAPASPRWEVDAAAKYEEPAQAPSRWDNEPAPRHEAPGSRPWWEGDAATGYGAATTGYEEAGPAQSMWDNEPAPRYEAPSARSRWEADPTRYEAPSPPLSRWDESAARYAEPVPAQPVWEPDPAPHHEEPAPRWPVREETARPPLERRKRSRSAQPAPRLDDAAQSHFEDPAETRARRQRLDAIQAQLERSSAPPEEPRSYRRETAEPHYDSRRADPDEFLPRQRRGSSVVPHDYPAATRYDQPDSQDSAPPAAPSRPERSMPRRRQPPPDRHDEHPQSWNNQPPPEPPTRRRRSSQPPNPASSGRHAAPQGARPPWQ
ncbi:hypothetical protein DFR70_105250 [Nocardia tenerifensis]|uniref:Uncharacterized protein n=1 Tax=Nocardia tenerifensis TaxID=228006 RepID=A0A318K1B8_9NOCA|nr:hypothetical protein DFR70_105250 [Nocardia tenerifensis]